MALALTCDFCNQPLKVEGNSAIRFNSRYDFVKEQYPCLCKNCRDKLDSLLNDYDAVSSERRAALYRRNAMINEHFRRIFNSKG